MEGGGRAGGASDGDEEERAWDGAPQHADKYGQSGSGDWAEMSLGALEMVQ